MVKPGVKSSRFGTFFITKKSIAVEDHHCQLFIFIVLSVGKEILCS